MKEKIFQAGHPLIIHTHASLLLLLLALPGGFHDAGDHLKLNFPLGTSLSFLAWGLLEFGQAYATTGNTQVSIRRHCCLDAAQTCICCCCARCPILHSPRHAAILGCAGQSALGRGLPDGLPHRG